MKRSGAGAPVQGEGRRGVASLSAEDERTLATRARAGDKSAADILVESHLPFVAAIARRYSRYGLPVNDLVQEGVVGLIQAIRRFNPSGDARLATYSMLWVKAAMRDYVIRSWSVVRIGTTARQKTLFFRLRRVASDLGSGLAGLEGERVDEVIRSLAQRFSVPTSDLMALARRIGGRDRSIEAQPTDRALGSLVEGLADTRSTPEEAVMERSDTRFWRTLLVQAMASLPYRERVIIHRRHLAETRYSFAAIAAELQLSKERVRQLEGKALEHLRHLIRAESDNCYATGPVEASRFRR